MASDDRDRTFEKALARHLRSSASSGVDANALAGAPGDRRAEFCPDPETLAAYHDGSLSPDERNPWKQHVLGCDHCQLVLAHLATPLDIPVHLDAGENVLVAQQRVASAKAASPAPIARPSPLHSLRWLWLVPAGAIAATLIAWVSLQEPKRLPGSPSSPVEIAENRQPAVSAPSPKPALVAPEELKRKDQPAAPSVGGAAGAALADRGLATKESQNQLQSAQQAPSRNAAIPNHGPYLSQQKQEQQINRIAAGNAGPRDQKKLDVPSSPNAIGGAAGYVAPRPSAAPQPPPPPPSSEPSFITDGSIPPAAAAKVAPPAPAPAVPANSREADSSSTTADTITSTSASASTALEVTAAPQSFAKTRAMMRAAALQNPHVFAAPSGKQLWRLGPAGSLEHSKDKGLNWMPQISGVYTDLLAGSAPSAKVCWIVGVSGTILRTTDSGTHWIKLDSPVTNDLTSVRATDATHALIWSVPDPQTGLIKIYQTSDGGATWSPASNP
ncbi:MAG TPA: hypothetical protein VFF95_03105 [Candidatus Binatus sp.]|jgi:hypothetical protein|nr:hypothetical protein [Candidatus Binatus sp.]